MNEANEHANDPNLEFERPDYGQDYYDEQAPGQEAEYADPELPPEKPKSSLWINIGIFGGVAVFALVMAWVNFGSVLFPPKTTANTAPQDANALLAPVTAAATPAAAPPVTAATPQPVIAAPGPVVAGAPNPISPAMPDQTASANPAAAGAPTDVAALSVTPGAPVTPPPATNPAATNVMPQAAAPAPMAALPTTPTVQPAMPDATTATALPVMPSAAPAADNSKLADLEKQNQDLTAKTAEQDATIADLKAQLSDAQAKLAQAQTTANTAPATPKPPKKVVKKQTAVHHVAVARPPVRNNDSDVPASTGPSGYLGGNLPAPPPYWVLRSAENNSAWVAHPGDSQLYQITVGDQLPGIGKIISIQQQVGGSWVVMGTQGQIRPE